MCMALMLFDTNVFAAGTAQREGRQAPAANHCNSGCKPVLPTDAPAAAICWRRVATDIWCTTECGILSLATRAPQHAGRGISAAARGDIQA
jgi:hypothetical protein